MTEKDPEQQPAETPNYYEIRQKSREEEVGELWQEELDVYDNVQFMLSISTLLPDFDIQSPILSAFIILPHMVLDLAPVGWGIGESGSGKSQVVALIKFLYQIPVPFGTSTAVGLRNVVMQHRFVNYNPAEPEKDWRERHFILCIDNATSDFLKADKNMQGLLLQGINRTTDKWLISGEKSGTILEFHTFCRKYISSCFPINDREVQRRCLIFQFEKSEDEIVADLIDLTTCNFDWNQYLVDYWTLERLNEFKDLGRAYPKKQFRGDKNRIFYYRDIHSILLMNGVENPIELINEFENRDIMAAQDTGLYQIIEIFLKQFSSKDKVDGLPREIPNRQFQRYINSRVSSEEIPRPTAREINEAMAQMGYSEKWDESGSYWVR